MNNFEYAEYVYGAIRRHNDKADKVASIESFLKSEYNNVAKSVYKKLEDAKDVFGPSVIDEIIKYVKEN